MSTGSPTTAQLWQQTVGLCKDRVNSRSFWEALERAVAIAVEDGTLIIGLKAEIFNQAGHLNVSEHRNAIETSASAAWGQPLRIRIIEGDTLADWESRKKRDARVAAHREASYDRRDQQAAEAQSWDSLYEYVARAYSATPLRSLPQARARYVTDMLYVIVDAMDQLFPAEPDEAVERLLARVIERVATNVEMPATLVALEVERLRAWRKQAAQ